MSTDKITKPVKDIIVEYTVLVAAETTKYLCGYAYRFFNPREPNREHSTSTRNTLAYNKKDFDTCINELEEHITKGLIKITDQQLKLILEYSSTMTSPDTDSTKKLLESIKDESKRAMIVLFYLKDPHHKKASIDASDPEKAHIWNGFYRHLINLCRDGKIFQEYFKKEPEIKGTAKNLSEEDLQSGFKP